MIFVKVLNDIAIIFLMFLCILKESYANNSNYEIIYFQYIECLLIDRLIFGNEYARETVLSILSVSFFLIGELFLMKNCKLFRTTIISAYS